MTALILFVSTFVLVFALGLQSLNVNGGHKLLAALTSFLISVSQLVVLKLVPGPTSVLEMLAYLTGGPLGILTSMAVHPLIARWFGRNDHRRDTPDIGGHQSDPISPISHPFKRGQAAPHPCGHSESSS